EPEDLAWQCDLGKRGDALRDVRVHVLLGLRVLLVETVGVALPMRSLLDDRDALVEVADTLHIDAEAEPVEQLRPELTFFGVHGADEDEARRMRYRDALALDRVDTHRRGVQQHVDD